MRKLRHTLLPHGWTGPAVAVVVLGLVGLARWLGWM